MKHWKKQFGGKVNEDLEKQYAKSPQWKDAKFENAEETNMSISIWDVPDLLYKQLCKKENREPKSPLPVIPFDKEEFLKGRYQFQICVVWSFGNPHAFTRSNNFN